VNIDLIEETSYERDGYEIIVRVLYDHDINPETDGDWATPEIIEAWKRDEWFYVGVQVRAVCYGALLAEDSLWGIPYGGDFSDNVLETASEIESWASFGDQIKVQVNKLIEQLEKVTA